MGKKRYMEKDVSKPMTNALGIADLLALKSSTDSHYYTVHKRYSVFAISVACLIRCAMPIPSRRLPAMVRPLYWA